MLNVSTESQSGFNSTDTGNLPPVPMEYLEVKARLHLASTESSVVPLSSEHMDAARSRLEIFSRQYESSSVTRPAVLRILRAYGEQAIDFTGPSQVFEAAVKYFTPTSREAFAIVSVENSQKVRVSSPAE